MRFKFPKLKLSIVRQVFLLVFCFLVTFAAGYFVGAKGFTSDLSRFPKVFISRQLPPDKQNLDFSLFWRVWDSLEANYFDKSKLNRSQMVYGAISGMVSALGDPYTVFLSPSENKVVEEDLSGSFEGVGIQIGFRGTQLVVVAPLPGSPAEKAGIKAGDFIIGIKDEAKKIDQGTIGISLPEAVKLIRGPAGSKVTLALTRDGVDKAIVVDVERVKLTVPSLIVSYQEDVAHIRLLKFALETPGEWEKAVGEIKQKGNVKGLVLDLRNNPGGYLEGAVDIAAEWLKLGSVVAIEEKGDGTKSEFITQRLGAFANMPTVIIINEGSASASEILAGALRDGKKIKIVGEKSFGKGTIQEPRQVDGGAGLHITIAKWLTPSGFWVNEKGLEPDVAVEDDIETSEDEQLLQAIKLLR